MTTTTEATPEKATPLPGIPVGVWITRCQVFALADGSFLLKPKRPVLRAGAKDTSKLTGLSSKTLARLAEAGFIRCCWPTARMPMYYPAEVEAFIRETEKDPDYWTSERRRQYGLGRLRKK